jgi:uncharacterized Ntn-hydrolase superfamily protein
MTWSIVARDPSTGAFAVAVTTCAFAVGARVPAGGGRIGALASQAFTNPLYMIDGLRLLQEGRTAEEIVAILTGGDPGRSHRQLHVVDRDGGSARWTGEDCVPWCGSVHAENVSVAGNMLAGPEVVQATLDAFVAGASLDLDDRLIAALDAGQAAGGDKRGKQSAALKIWTSEPFPILDMRVDDHPEPLAELRRLQRVAHQRFVPYQAACPTRADPAGVTDRAELDRRVAAHAAAWNAKHPG